MGTSKSRKSTGARGRAGSRSNRTRPERPVTPLEKAEAIVYVHENGGKKVTPARNPFFQDTGSADTVAYVASGIEYLSQMSLNDSGTANKELEFGQYLFLQTMWEALTAAQEQMRAEYELLQARATVRALKGEA